MRVQEKLQTENFFSITLSPKTNNNFKNNWLDVFSALTNSKTAKLIPEVYKQYPDIGLFSTENEYSTIELPNKQEIGIGRCEVSQTEQILFIKKDDLEIGLFLNQSGDVIVINKAKDMEQLVEYEQVIEHLSEIEITQETLDTNLKK